MHINKKYIPNQKKIPVCTPLFLKSNVFKVTLLWADNPQNYFLSNFRNRR